MTTINRYISSSFESESKILISPSRVCYALYEAVKDFEIVKIDTDITTNFKAIKNDIEIENYKKVTIIDGVSLVKFIKWASTVVKNVSAPKAGDSTGGVDINAIPIATADDDDDIW